MCFIYEPSDCMYCDIDMLLISVILCSTACVMIYNLVGVVVVHSVVYVVWYTTINVCMAIDNIFANNHIADS